MCRWKKEIARWWHVVEEESKTDLHMSRVTKREGGKKEKKVFFPGDASFPSAESSSAALNRSVRLPALIQREKERETRLRRNWSWHPPPQCMVCRSVVWRSAGGTIFGLLFPANALSPPLEAWVKWKNAAVGIVRRQTLSFFCDPPIVFESILC